MCLGNDTENETFIFNNVIFNNSKEEKIFGITIDNQQTNICSKLTVEIPEKSVKNLRH